VASVLNKSDHRPTVADPRLDLILTAHRLRIPPRLVQCLPELCFALENTREPKGGKYLLWRPVLEFIQLTYAVDVEEWLCNAGVALAYVDHKAAEVLTAIIAPIEDARRNNPFRSEETARVVVTNVLSALAARTDERGGPDPSQIIAMLTQLKRQKATRPGINANTGVELAHLALSLPESSQEALSALLRSFRTQPALTTEQLIDLRRRNRPASKLGTLALPPHLERALRRRECIVFVGAGLSVRVCRSNGRSLPTWSQLLSELLDFSIKEQG
jgi:hypothetical protein